MLLALALAASLTPAASHTPVWNPRALPAVNAEAGREMRSGEDAMRTRSGAGPAPREHLSPSEDEVQNPFIGLPALCAPASHGTPATLLVSPAWLSIHLHDPGLVVLAMDQDGFERGHIPGAHPFAYMDTHLMESHGLTLEMPPVADIANTFASLGVSNQSRVVLYTGGTQLAALARVLTTLDLIGLGGQVSILDGGLVAWNNAHLPLETGTTRPTPRTLDPCPQSDVVIDYAFVTAHFHQPGFQIIDARATPFYTGAQQGDKQRPGHIPGALNIPYTTITTDRGTVKTPAELTALFTAAGVTPGHTLIAYCHVGQQANAVRFAARLLGYQVYLYDGSWEDWSAHPQSPTKTGPQP